MSGFSSFLKKEGVRRAGVFIGVGIILYLMRELMNLFLLTFIFTYLIYSAQSFLIKKLKKFVKVKQRIMAIALYVILAGTVIYVGYKYIPQMYNETKNIIVQIKDYYNKPHEGEMEKYIFSMLEDIEVKNYVNQSMDVAFKYITNVGKFGLYLLVSIILSMFFILERGRILRFTSRFKGSALGPVYNEIRYFGEKFLHSFAKVIQAQFIISLTNSLLSVIALYFMGFTNVIGLGVMIFILGLVPVAGAFISLIPLSMIAFSLGGIQKVLAVLVMIAILHALESYVLNPKLMSDKTELPVFYTFLILFVSEHFLGVWGLIVGIPIFMFVLDILNANKESEEMIEDDD